MCFCLDALPSALKGQLLYVTPEMIIGENSAISHIDNEKYNLYFVATLGDSCSYLLFTSTTSKYEKR